MSLIYITANKDTNIIPLNWECITDVKVSIINFINLVMTYQIPVIRVRIAIRIITQLKMLKSFIRIWADTACSIRGCIL